LKTKGDKAFKKNTTYNNQVTIFEDGIEASQSSAVLVVYGKGDYWPIPEDSLPGGSAVPPLDTLYWGHVIFQSPCSTEFGSQVCVTITLQVSFAFITIAGTNYHFTNSVMLKNSHYAATPYLCDSQTVDLEESSTHIQTSFLLSDHPC